MPRYFLHLAGQLPANDLMGHECINDDEALEHGSFIAHRVGTEKPNMVREENFIFVTNERGDELFKVPITSTLSAGTEGSLRSSRRPCSVTSVFFSRSLTSSRDSAG